MALLLCWGFTFLLESDISLAGYALFLLKASHHLCWGRPRPHCCWTNPTFAPGAPFVLGRLSSLGIPLLVGRLFLVWRPFLLGALLFFWGRPTTAGRAQLLLEVPHLYWSASLLLEASLFWWGAPFLLGGHSCVEGAPFLLEASLFWWGAAFLVGRPLSAGVPFFW